MKKYYVISIKNIDNHIYVDIVNDFSDIQSLYGYLKPFVLSHYHRSIVKSVSTHKTLHMPLKSRDADLCYIINMDNNVTHYSPNNLLTSMVFKEFNKKLRILNIRKIISNTDLL